MNDGSTDKSYEIIGSYAQTDSRIKLPHLRAMALLIPLNQKVMAFRSVI